MIESTDTGIRVVLFPTDFSEPAGIALSWAMRVARRHGAELKILHAISRSLPFVERLEPYSALARMPTGKEEKMLADLVSSLQSPDQPIEGILTYDRPSVATLQSAKRHRADLIVLGTRGEGGVPDLLLGSTVERVAQRATCPVLAVPPDARRAGPIRRVLIGTDFSIEADSAIRAAERILQLASRPIEILLLCVLRPPLGLEHDSQVTSLWRDYVAECRALLNERKDLLLHSLQASGLRAHALLREGIPADEIVRVANIEGVDVVVLGSRGSFAAGRPFLGSVSKRTLQIAHCPVLTAPSLLSRRMRKEARA